MLPSPYSSTKGFRETSELRVLGAVPLRASPNPALERLPIESLSTPQLRAPSGIQHLLAEVFSMLNSGQYKSLENLLRLFRIDELSLESSWRFFGALVDECGARGNLVALSFVANYWEAYVEFCDARDLPLIYAASATLYLNSRHVKFLDNLSRDISYELLMEFVMIRFAGDEARLATSRFLDARNPDIATIRAVYIRSRLLNPAIGKVLERELISRTDNDFAPIPSWVYPLSSAKSRLKASQELISYSAKTETRDFSSLHKAIDEQISQAAFRIFPPDILAQVEKHFRNSFLPRFRTSGGLLSDKKVLALISDRWKTNRAPTGIFSLPISARDTALLSLLKKSSQVEKEQLISRAHLLDALRSLGANASLSLVCGPAHPLLSSDPDDFFLGGFRMLLDASEWFTGHCGYCIFQIRTSQHAIRMPRAFGGWTGCYCSFSCLRKEISWRESSLEEGEKRAGFEDTESHTKFEIQRRILRKMEAFLGLTGIVIPSGSILALKPSDGDRNF